MPVAPLTIPAGFRNNFGDVRTGGSVHKGLDIPPTKGAAGDVRSPEKGEVVAVWTNDITAPFVGYGPGGVIIKGDSGVFHLLAHLDPVQLLEGGVKIGQRFDEGEQVGLISLKGPLGNGQPTKTWEAPHVHWEVRTKFGGPTINPIAWLAGKIEGFGIEWWVWLLVGWAISQA